MTSAKRIAQCFGAGMVLALAHCSLRNLDYLDSVAPGDGGPDAGDADAPSPTTGTGTGGSGGSGGVADAADADDGGDIDVADVGAPEVDAGPPPPLTFCGDAGTYFCDDFDELALPSRFDDLDGTFLNLTSSSAKSAPNSLELLVPSSSVGNLYASKMSKTFQRVGGTITVQFDLLPVQLDTTTAGLLIVAVDFIANQASQYSVRLAFHSRTMRIEESWPLTGKPDTYHTQFGPLSSANWSRVALQMNRLNSDGVPATASITVNGVRPGGVGTETLQPPLSVNLTPTLRIGAVSGNSPDSGWKIRFDNVTFDIQ
jgi:hypothetical protein